MRIKRFHRHACVLVLRDLLGSSKEMVACYKPEILKDLIPPRKIQDSKYHKLKAITCV